MSPATDVREAVFGFVLRFPGAHAREIERQLALSSRLAAYHLGALEAEGRVARIDDHGYARWFERERARALSAAERRFILYARRPPARRILVLLAAEGELTQGEITARVDSAKASTSYHLSDMHKAGLLAMRVEGRHRYYGLKHPERTKEMLRDLAPLPGEDTAFARMWADLFGMDGARDG